MERGSAQAYPKTIWSNTCRYAAPGFAPLKGERSCAVAVIGGGFTGLSAAHHLAEAGVECVVVEADEIGFGASGRTAGMAGTRYKKPYSELAQHYGTEVAGRLHALVHEALGMLEAIVARYGVEDAFVRCGQLIPAHTAEMLDVLGRDVAWLRDNVGDRAPVLLDRAATARALGSEGYVGAWYDPRGGGVQPMDLVRGVALGLARRGVPVFTRTPVVRIAEEAGRVVLQAAGGTLVADRVILATNAYTPPGLAPLDLHRRVVPVSSSIVVTEPLSENVARTVLPQGNVASDTKRLLHAFRMLPGNRLLYSGRAEITGRRAGDPASYRILEDSLAATFPQVEPRISHRWSGYVAVSRDAFPHVGRASERIVYAMGYSGRGVALSHLLGAFAARLVRGEAVDAGPMGESGFQRWPFHGLRIPGMQLTAAIYNLRDRWEARAG
jgi:glycine/D-amino acid oxidase-like deaminating enzyme